MAYPFHHHHHFRRAFVLFLFYATKLTTVLSKQCIYRLWDLIVNVNSNNTLSQSLFIKYFPHIPFYPLFTYSEWNFISYCSFSGVQISSWAQSLQRNRVSIPAPVFCVGLHALLVLTVHGFSPGIPVSLKSLKNTCSTAFSFSRNPEWGQLVHIGSKGFQNMGFSTPLTH